MSIVPAMVYFLLTRRFHYCPRGPFPNRPMASNNQVIVHPIDAGPRMPRWSGPTIRFGECQGHRSRRPRCWKLSESSGLSARSLVPAARQSAKPANTTSKRVAVNMRIVLSSDKKQQPNTQYIAATADGLPATRRQCYPNVAVHFFALLRFLFSVASGRWGDHGTISSPGWSALTPTFTAADEPLRAFSSWRLLSLSVALG